MSEHMILSIGAASAVSFIGVMLIFAAVYALGLWIEWWRRR